MRVGKVAISIGLLALCGIGILTAQTTFSTIRGTITDQTDAVVPGVDVLVVEMRTGFSRRVVSDDRGNYEIPELKPGTYRLTATLPGFKTYVAEQVVLESAQLRRIDVLLQVGGSADEIIVSAGTEVITREGGEITTGFDGETFKDIPLVDTYPGPLSMLATTPGIQGDGWVVSVAGQESLQVTQEFGGVPNDRSGNQSANVNLYNEVKIVAVNNTADQSRMASYNMINRRGGNDFQGMLWWKHVNSALNAREYFDAKKTQYKLHEYQAEVSGAILKNRTFYYVSYFGQQFPAGSFKNSHVPTLLMRQGDFSQISKQIIDPLTGEPFPNNIIPPERLNQMSLTTQQLYIPVPNQGDGPADTTNNLGWDFPFPSDKYRADMINFRVDHNLSDNSSIFGVFNKNWVPYVVAFKLPAFTWTRNRRYGNIQISNTHVFTAAVINTARFGINTNYLFDGATNQGVTPLQGDEAVAAIGLEGVNPSGLQGQGSPIMLIDGFSILGVPSGGFRARHNDYYLEDSVTLAQGRNVWKFGFQHYKYNDFEARAKDGTYGLFKFDGHFTGHSYADFILGLPALSRRLDPLIPREMETIELGVFLMNTFKVTPHLTIDYGLRWDYFGSDTIKDNLMYRWDRDSGNVIIPAGTLSQVSPLYPTTINLVEGEVVPNASKTNFRPRVGLAYRMPGELVFRGGYGLFTERLHYFARVQKTGPFELGEDYQNEIVNGQPLFSFPNPFPDLSLAAVPSQSVTGYPMETKNGLIHQFNISVEKELAGIGLRGSYVGSRSRNLNYTLNLNKPEPSTIPFTSDRRPFPEFVGTTYWENNGSSNYNSFQIEAKKRAGIFTFNGHYTLASNLHNHYDRENPYNVTNNWSYDDFMQRNRAVITTQIELPFGRGQRYMTDAPGAVDTVLGGWKIFTMSYFGTGAHFSPSFSGADPSNTNSFGGLPDRTCDGNLDRGSRGVDGWFDPSCFTVPAEGGFGDSAPNVLIAPGLNVHHLSLAKRFNVREMFDMMFTIAASNIFNHPHFNPPRSNISASDPGVITSGIQAWRAEKHASRKVSLKLRIEW